MSWLVVVVALLTGLQSMAERVTLDQQVHGSLQRNLINTAGLMDTLKNEGPFTLFLPSERSLRQFFYTYQLNMTTVNQYSAQVKDFVRFHIVNGTLSPQDLYNERVLTALNGWEFRVNNYGDGAVRTVQGSRLYDRAYASNGMLYYLTSPMATPRNESIADIINNGPELTTLINATLETGLDAFLADQSPVTLFAPTDAAFSALGDKLDTLMANPQLMAEVLKYHVVPGTVYTAGMHLAELPTFAADDRLHLSVFFGHHMVEGAHIKLYALDISASNGVIHLIDRVLIPASLRDQI